MQIGTTFWVWDTGESNDLTFLEYLHAPVIFFLWILYTIWYNYKNLETGPEVIKLFMLNSAENQICSAHKILFTNNLNFSPAKQSWVGNFSW